MIISVNHIEAWAEAEIRRGSPCQPIAMKTRFGWTLVGGWARNSLMYIAYLSTTINDAILHRDVEKSFLHDHMKMPENVGEKASSKTTSVYDFILWLFALRIHYLLHNRRLVDEMKIPMQISQQILSQKCKNNSENGDFRQKWPFLTFDLCELCLKSFRFFPKWYYVKDHWNSNAIYLFQCIISY